MEYIYSALVLHAAGKEINADNVKAVLKGAGVDADDSRVKALVAALDGVDIAEAVKTAIAAAPAGAPAAAAEAPAEEEEEEKGPSEEEAMAGLGSLFG